jgi:NodT family efflux transporter outer membrane factor (OMF) lipoprotein
MKSKIIGLIIIFFIVGSCAIPKKNQNKIQKNLPDSYTLSVPTDTSSIAQINWRKFFNDPYLINLIDSALVHNQELNIFLQDIEIAQYEVLEKKGEYLPKVGIGAGIGTSKVSEHTRDGALDKILDQNEHTIPSLDLGVGFSMAWELDIWHKLRNAKNAAEMRFLAQKEGKNLMVSRLVTEIARNYYELMALDNSIQILNENIKIQEEAYYKMKILKDYAKANQLAVNRFEAQLINTKNQKFSINQKIIETENFLKFLTGNFSLDIKRNSNQFMFMKIDSLQSGVPAQLLENRPDIRQANYAIQSAEMDYKSIKANFYPSLGIRSGIGFSAFDPSLLINPQSLIYNLAGDLVAPIINRNALIARLKTANAYQIQTVLYYEQTLLQAFTEVLNQLSGIENAKNSFTTKQNEVKILNESVDIANSLFQYAKADYVEVLLTQEERLKAEMELVETQLQLMGSKIDLYRALGGGWR